MTSQVRPAPPVLQPRPIAWDVVQLDAGTDSGSQWPKARQGTGKGGRMSGLRVKTLCDDYPCLQLTEASVHTSQPTRLGTTTPESAKRPGYCSAPQPSCSWVGPLRRWQRHPPSSTHLRPPAFCHLRPCCRLCGASRTGSSASTAWRERSTKSMRAVRIWCKCPTSSRPTVGGCGRCRAGSDSVTKSSGEMSPAPMSHECRGNACIFLTR